MSILATLYQSSVSPAEYVRGYFGRLEELIGLVDANTVAKVIEVIENATREDKTIFSIANGGSAAIAVHFVNDMSNCFAPDHPGYRVLSLTDNTESVTAIANDSGFENIFVHQLRSSMRSGDIVFAISVGDNSENVLRGVAYAREHGGYTIGWTGFSGGRLARMCYLSIHIPSTTDEYGPI